MIFEEILDQAIAMLQRRGRMTYRTLQRQFALDDDALTDLKDELLYTHPEIRDDAGRGLVWTGDPSIASPAWRCRRAWGSTPAKLWCGRLATTCTWTIPPWARPRTWQRVWSNSPPRAVSG